MNSFDDPMKVGEYLEHHGILGMKWGKQNGPPYPLSEKKHDAIVKREQKKREKILNDPKKLSKNIRKFSDEEIEGALKKFEQRKKVEAHIPKKVKHPKKKEVKLSFMKKIWAKDVKTLARHIDSFTPEELTRAKDILKSRNEVFNLQIDALQKPNKVLNVGAEYLKTIASYTKSGSEIVKNVSGGNKK